MSLTTIPATPTIISLPTPFVQASTCSGIFSTTSISRLSTVYSGTTSFTSTFTASITISDRSNPSFTACQPSGWGKEPPESQFSFSPAVCPSGWTAYDLDTTAAAVSTAFCCASGYTYSSPIWLDEISISGVSPSACYNTGPATVAATTTSILDNGPYPSAITAHDAYHISWRQLDQSTISPAPPNLTCSIGGINSWDPASTAKPTTYCDDDEASSGNDGSLHLTPAFAFLVIGLPVIVGVLILACIGYCAYRAHKNRVQKRDLLARRGNAIPLT